ncbi:MAG TPA: prolyl-tRNA synthetase associated domain-containing protein [Erysipelotrichaceae bacterium]|nr:prolyl-tRNA synthetase associated domain-containing protein [Erysipelotrichaceae bacterium]HQB32255.1 prolyl-tRNA synthetase associated domain-containing protein [Erysipelotrichaceae bacterium]
MNKEEIYELLESYGIKYEVTEHEAVFNMEETKEVNLPYPDCMAKNLFVRDNRKRNYYMITVRGDKRVNLKDFAHKQNLKALQFASAADLMKILKLDPGSVTPFGLLNDTEGKVILFVDEAFGADLIGVHPNDNTVTIWLKTADLTAIIKRHGNDVISVKIQEN